MRRKVKFLLLFFTGFCILMPLFLSVIVYTPPSLYRVLFATQYLGGFTIYCYLLYHRFYKRQKPKYPLMLPEGRMTDYYFPRSDFPRLIHEDMRRYPNFFKRKKRKYKKQAEIKRKARSFFLKSLI